MKIAILGTRGIPNYHGGFEQFAEYFAVFMADQGHSVVVYNSHNHPYKEDTYEKVKIIHSFDPEHLLGTAGQFIYDFNCIVDIRKRKFDVILQLGYTSSSIWGRLLPKQSVIVTNMDGLEWKRTKYSKMAQSFLKKAEKWAVKSSDYLISDSIGIKNYLYMTYSIDSKYIAYGASLFESQNQDILIKYGLVKYQYNLLIARLEPENNIETILLGVKDSNTENLFIVIGNHDTKYGRYLKIKFKSCDKIKFLGSIYNLDILNNLRYFSDLYFHGHSVGGTNPSLLEAMASNCLIIAHDNIFNKSILEEDAFYFSDSSDVKTMLLEIRKKNNDFLIENNKNKIKNNYSWSKINNEYLEYLQKCL
jgi:glycosyltransferase involved in cell wall biosynthesis